MHILLVVDRPPMPARDGATIPMAGLIRVLNAIGSVTLVMAGDFGDDPVAIIDKQKLLSGCASVVYVRRLKRSKLVGVFNELIFGIPFFHNWKYEFGKESVNFKDVDLIVSSPIGALDLAIRLQKSTRAILFASISDVFTSFLRSSPYAGSAGSRVRAAMMRLRGGWFGRVEQRLLMQCDKVFVQTARDVEWLGVVGGSALRERGVAFSNGVDDSLIDIPLPDSTPGPIVLFLASYTDPHYREMLRWLLLHIWPTVSSSVEGARLRVVGKGVDIDASLISLVRSSMNVDYCGFVERLEEAYVGVRVSVAPIFKKYGFINKVAESLAVGVPVVGDSSAFNGLEQYLGSVGNCVAETPADFSRLLIEYLTNDQRWEHEAMNAKAFAKDRLTWDANLMRFQDAMRGLV